MSISGLLKFKAALDASTATPEKRELIAKRTEKFVESYASSFGSSKLKPNKNSAP